MNFIKNVFANKRVQSFLWRTAMMIIALIVGQITSNLPLLTPYVSPATIIVLGLILGEISKAIANYIKEIPSL